MGRKERKKKMPSNNVKYSEEMREQTAKYILETGKSATGVAEEKGIAPLSPKKTKDEDELTRRIKELEGKLKDKDKEIKKLSDRVADEQEKVEILKKSLHIFMQPRE